MSVEAVKLDYIEPSGNFALVFFEDTRWRDFAPLTYARPVYEVRVGALPLWLKYVLRLRPAVVSLYMRRYLSGYFRWFYSVRFSVKNLFVNEFRSEGVDKVLVVNGRLFPTRKLLEDIIPRLISIPGNVLVAKGREFGILSMIPQMFESVEKYFRQPLEIELLDYLSHTVEVIEDEDLVFLSRPYEPIKMNVEELEKDIELLKSVSEVEEVEKGVYVEKGAEISGDARLKPPVYVAYGAKVMEYSVIQGPAYIGVGSVVLPHAYIRNGSVIGQRSVVGGEVKNSIIHGNSNKEHHGYLGDSYVCEWVNLGAGTTVSNLKNTYGEVRFRGERTGMRKLGALIGDWAKTGIGTLIFTGKTIGPSAHTIGFVTEDVPAFTYWAKPIVNELIEVDVEKAVEIHRRMKRSRGEEITDHEIEIIREVYRVTADERSAKGVVKGEMML